MYILLGYTHILVSDRNSSTWYVQMLVLGSPLADEQVFSEEPVLLSTCLLVPLVPARLVKPNQVHKALPIEAFKRFL